MKHRAVSLFLLAALFCLAVWSAAPELSGPTPARPDEVCVVCYGAVGSNGIAYLVNGVRYAVSKEEAPIFLTDPEGYAKRFDEHQRPKRSSVVMGGGVATLTVLLIIVAARRRRMRRQAG
ncbi:hypothetical protein [uncultured Paludibaculum sp.]|uniref:hypothetical protein n=1 Tax=uncultured Paludibaculum sp. TaxID=1765020 RepID=UPI002AABF034|nr:hypothetical protein [uncultured Paludibaculum sp.]